MSDRRSMLGFVVLFAACGPVVGEEGADGTTGGSGDPGPVTTAATLDPPQPTTSPTTDPSTDPTFPTSATTPDPDTGPQEGSEGVVDDGGYDDAGCLFLCEPDGGATNNECDVWAQDCPDGEKCMPWANDGGATWNAARCSPIDPSNAVGEPCSVEGSAVSGLDDCTAGAMCLYVDADTNVGTCVANCEGSEANPSCPDPATACVIAFEGTLHQCLPTCDPFVDDCAQGRCHPHGALDVEGFACGAPILPSVPDFAACNVDWECTPHSMCPREDQDPACEDGRCCTPICDLGVPEACGPERVCRPVFAEGQSPPGFELHGYCALP